MYKFGIDYTCTSVEKTTHIQVWSRLHMYRCGIDDTCICEKHATRHMQVQIVKRQDDMLVAESRQNKLIK